VCCANESPVPGCASCKASWLWLQVVGKKLCRYYRLGMWLLLTALLNELSEIPFPGFVHLPHFLQGLGRMEKIILSRATKGNRVAIGPSSARGSSCFELNVLHQRATITAVPILTGCSTGLHGERNDDGPKTRKWYVCTVCVPQWHGMA